MRPSNRAPDEMRKVTITRNYTRHAEGSVLVEFGDTRVICTASVETRVPGFLRGKGQGWVTAEYGMLPRSTGNRMDREAARGKQGGRTMEIQRLIGRSLRAGIDLEALGENTISIDCDVIQADGGTRTASIIRCLGGPARCGTTYDEKRPCEKKSPVSPDRIGVGRHLQRHTGTRSRLCRRLECRNRYECSHE